MYSDDLWNMILMLLQVDVNKRIDCNQFLNNDLIKRKIEEMKKEPNIFIESYIENYKIISPVNLKILVSKKSFNSILLTTYQLFLKKEKFL